MKTNNNLKYYFQYHLIFFSVLLLQCLIGLFYYRPILAIFFMLDYTYNIWIFLINNHTQNSIFFIFAGYLIWNLIFYFTNQKILKNHKTNNTKLWIITLFETILIFQFTYVILEYFDLLIGYAI